MRAWPDSISLSAPGSRSSTSGRVLLVRYAVGANATVAAGPPQVRFTRLADYARLLHHLPAFLDTADFDAFRAQLAQQPGWLLAS